MGVSDVLLKNKITIIRFNKIIVKKGIVIPMLSGIPVRFMFIAMALTSKPKVMPLVSVTAGNR